MARGRRSGQTQPRGAGGTARGSGPASRGARGNRRGSGSTSRSGRSRGARGNRRGSGSTSRTGRTSRAPLNRDEALVPLIARTEEPGLIVADYVAQAEGTEELDMPLSTLTQPRATSVANASSNSQGEADADPTIDTAMEAQWGDAEDGVRDDADGESVLIQDLIDLTEDEPTNGTGHDIIETLGEMNGRGLFIVDSDEDDNDTAIRAENYVVVKPLELSNDVFECLLETLSSGGIVYSSPKGKGREVTPERRDTSTSSHDTMGGTRDSETDLASTLAAMASGPVLSSEPPVSEEGSEIDPAVLVSVHRPELGYGHAVFRAKKAQATGEYAPLTALYFYQLLRFSEDLQLEAVNKLVDRMSPDAIKLATARSPIFMDQRTLYGHPFTGFRHLGYLEQSNAGDTIEPVLDSEGKRQLLNINGMDESLDMYVLYIWTDDHTSSSGMTIGRYPQNAIASSSSAGGMTVASDPQNAMASSSAASQDDDLIPEEYQRYFRTLVLRAQNRDTTFSMFMHIRIVTEICDKLFIPCGHGLHINERHLVDGRWVSVSDVIQRLGHRKPGTFNNHRGHVHLARRCLEYLELSDSKESEKMFVQQAIELLRTPLDAAMKLNPSQYGNMKEFNNQVKLIANRLEIKRIKEERKENSGSESE